MATDSKQYYASEYNQLGRTLPGSHLNWLKQTRDTALANFSRSGFPSPREEEWRYTNIAPIERKLFSARSADSQPETVEFPKLESYIFEGAAALVFVDGVFCEELSALPVFDEGVVVASIAKALQDDPDRVEQHFASLVAGDAEGFLAFNTALFTGGAFIYIPSGIELECPIQLVFVSSRADGLSTTRNLVVAEPGSRAEIIETYLGFGDAGSLTAAVSELVVAENADIRWTKLQSEADRGFHFGGLYAGIGRHGRLQHGNFSFGGLLVRNEVHVDQKQASDCTLNGLFLGRGRQHVDNHTRNRHLEAHGVSRQFYKGILDQRARGVFQGRIVVEQDAQKTDSEMANRNLLLSKDAEVDTKPQLEIYADDVKCAHGVTVGQLADESVFYLQSRGIDPDSARNMLTFAFANEMVEKIESKAMRSWVRDRLLNALPQTEIRKEWL